MSGGWGTNDGMECPVPSTECEVMVLSELGITGQAASGFGNLGLASLEPPGYESANINAFAVQENGSLVVTGNGLCELCPCSRVSSTSLATTLRSYPTPASRSTTSFLLGFYSGSEGSENSIPR